MFEGQGEEELRQVSVGAERTFGTLTTPWVRVQTVPALHTGEVKGLVLLSGDTCHLEAGAILLFPRARPQNVGCELLQGRKFSRNVRKAFLRGRAVWQWKRLPGEMMDSSLLEAFKWRLDDQGCLSCGFLHWWRGVSLDSPLGFLLPPQL